MGTTSTSGWAVFLFFLGFTLVGTLAVGSTLGFIVGLASIGYSVVLFSQAKSLEADK